MICRTASSRFRVALGPEVGHDRGTPGRRSCLPLFDRLPEHTVMVMTPTVKPPGFHAQPHRPGQAGRGGDSAEAELTREDAEAVEREMARGNKLYPLCMAFYVRGSDLKSLRANINQLNALLLPNGLQPILQEADLLALDSYIRNLPMAYDVSLDKINRRSRLVFSSHTANLLPLYGRSKGTGHPGLVFFNRGAEPLVFDPLHHEDRKKNAHMLILGPPARASPHCWSICCSRWPRCTVRASSSSRPGFILLLGQDFQANGLGQSGHAEPERGRESAAVCRCLAHAGEGEPSPESSSIPMRWTMTKPTKRAPAGTSSARWRSRRAS